MRHDLYKKLKVLSAAEGKSIQTLLEEAVTQYLDYRKFSYSEESSASGVAESAERYLISFDVSKDKKKDSGNDL